MIPEGNPKACVHETYSNIFRCFNPRVEDNVLGPPGQISDTINRRRMRSPSLGTECPHPLRMPMWNEKGTQTHNTHTHTTLGQLNFVFIRCSWAGPFSTNVWSRSGQNPSLAQNRTRHHKRKPVAILNTRAGGLVPPPKGEACEWLTNAEQHRRPRSCMQPKCILPESAIV